MPGETIEVNVFDALPDWTVEDFTGGSVPHAWVLEHGDGDVYKTMRYRDMTAEAARKLGIKNFVSQYNAYEKTHRQKPVAAESGATDYEDQPLELLTGEYLCNDEAGVVGWNAYHERVQICSHPIMPTKRMINVDTGETQLEIAYRRGGRWRYQTVPRTMLATASQIVGLAAWGVGVDSENAKALVRYFTELEGMNYTRLPEINSTGRLGWVGDDLFAPYVKDLQYDGDPSGAALFRGVEQAGSPAVWLDYFGKARARNVVTKIVLAASFASCMVKPCRTLPFIVHTWGGTEAGKAQPLDTKIITPDGYKLMGDIQIGDRIIGGDGKPHVVTGVFPQGVKDIYELTFADGRKTRCCAEHLWNVSTRTRRNHGRGYKTMELREMLKSHPIKGKKGFEYRVPLCSPVEYDGRNKLPIDPYLLGALIGDGCITLTLNAANGQRPIYFSNTEQDVIERVDSCLRERGAWLCKSAGANCQYDVRGCKWLKEAIVELGLNKGSLDKFIPEMYLTASRMDRERLLCGLMDTDGHVAEHGSCSYATSSQQLALDVMRLARSLGYRANIRSADRAGKDNTEFNVYISADSGIFLSDKHRKRKSASIEARSKAEDKHSLAITDVRACGQAECQCIMVDSDEHTYLCDDFIVTHNTVGLMSAISVWGVPTADGGLLHTFNTTDVGVEVLASVSNSIPVFIDELQIAKDRKSFDEFIYKFAEGVGRTRGAKAGGLQQMKRWANIAITTGEMPISTANSGGGAVNRVIEIDCKGQQLFENPREAVGIMSENYGHAGRYFVSLLQNNIELARDLQEDYLAQLRRTDVTDKQALSASLILAADHLAAMWMFGDEDRLTVDEILPFLSTREQVDINARALDWLYGWVAENINSFTSHGDYDSGKVYGRMDGDKIMIIRQTLNDAMTNAGYNVHAFLVWAREKGLLDCPAGRLDKTVRLRDGSPARCVVIKSLAEDPPEADFDPNLTDDLPM